MPPIGSGKVQTYKSLNGKLEVHFYLRGSGVKCRNEVSPRDASYDAENFGFAPAANL